MIDKSDGKDVQTDCEKPKPTVTKVEVWYRFPARPPCGQFEQSCHKMKDWQQDGRLRNLSGCWTNRSTVKDRQSRWTVQWKAVQEGSVETILRLGEAKTVDVPRYLITYIGCNSVLLF
jgi:hypothetical protein